MGRNCAPENPYAGNALIAKTGRRLSSNQQPFVVMDSRAQLRTIARRCAAPRNDRRPALRGPSETLSINRLAKISAEALDALAGVLEVGGLGRIGDAERRPKTEGRALHHRDAFGFQKLGDKVLVIG